MRSPSRGLWRTDEDGSHVSSGVDERDFGFVKVKACFLFFGGYVGEVTGEVAPTRRLTLWTAQISSIQEHTTARHELHCCGRLRLPRHPLSLPVSQHSAVLVLLLRTLSDAVVG